MTGPILRGLRRRSHDGPEDDVFGLWLAQRLGIVVDQRTQALADVQEMPRGGVVLAPSAKRSRSRLGRSEPFSQLTMRSRKEGL